jgi:hypothetical protein
MRGSVQGWKGKRSEGDSISTGPTVQAFESVLAGSDNAPARITHFTASDRCREEEIMVTRRSAIIVSVVVLGIIIGSISADAAVTLEVLNPRGEIPPLPALAPAPRVASLEGKTIGIYWNGKQGGNNFWDNIEELLKERFPGAKIVRYKGPFDLGNRTAAVLAKEVDLFLYGVGD